MKTKIFLVLCLCCVFLSGCTYDADRIYTVCKETSDSIYAYNTIGDFVVKDKNTGSISVVKDSSLIAQPKLLLNLREGNYSFVELLPNSYHCDFDSFNFYVNKCIVDGASTLEINLIDYKSVDLLLTCEEYTVRCYYTNNDIVRLYAINSDGNPITPPYINEGM